MGYQQISWICLGVYVCACLPVCLSACLPVYLRVHACMHVLCTCVCASVCVCVCVCKHMQTYEHIMCVCVCVYLCLSVCVLWLCASCMYVHAQECLCVYALLAHLLDLSLCSSVCGREREGSHPSKPEVMLKSILGHTWLSSKISAPKCKGGG